MADPYVWNVQRGDHLCLIAYVKGVSDWKTVWDYNTDLQSLRENPNLLYVGDTVLVPLAEDGAESGATSADHPFLTPDTPLNLRLRILNSDFTPAVNLPYVFTPLVNGAGEAWPEGFTNSAGQIELTDIPVDATYATLTIRLPATTDESGALVGEIPVTWDLWLGALHPIEEPAPDDACIPGVMQRLNNLGFDCGAIDDTGFLNNATKAAIRSFCRKVGIAEREEPDSEFLRKLAEVHDEEAS